MKVLFLAEHDGYNAAIVNIIKALMRRGHEVIVCSRQTNDNYTYVLRESHIPVHDITNVAKRIDDF
ncbi:MAG TPA: hypothetical protein PLZ84_07810, partial [Clostridia bacterium]|nr:hypothetical protein [Clostridia bacterium]